VYRGVSWWINRIWLKPIWYTDQFGITSQLRPGENIVHTLSTRSHFDDTGTVALLRQILKPGMVVFDVGANKGDFALHAALLVQPNGRVYAFEPVKYSFDYLCENIVRTTSAASVIKPHKLAVFSESGEVTIHTFPEGVSGWNTLGDPYLNPNMQKDFAVSAELVTAVTLDEFCEQHGISTIDLLKIDVEGFEPEVIEGAAMLVAQGRVTAVIFEISLAPLYGANRTAAEVLEKFINAGFEVSCIGEDGVLKSVEDPHTFTIPYFANYYAKPIARKTSMVEL
jgi:FkbM family methyltransferase